jgi:transglutaminase-like putative cysteine protease
LGIYLKPTYFIDSDTPSVVRFAEEHAGPASGDVEKAVKLYYAVRDRIRYDPYRIDLSRPAMRASAVLEKRRGFCVTKAVLLAASARALGIPGRLGFADVRNHLTTERLQKMMQSDIFVFHGYIELFLEDKWVKCTPAFNLLICSRFGVGCMEFDGRRDSIFQPFDRAGNKHMEYLKDHGHFDDLPHGQLVAAFTKEYPLLYSDQSIDIAENFEDDALTEGRQGG